MTARINALAPPDGVPVGVVVTERDAGTALMDCPEKPHQCALNDENKR
jgi:hypothetical protein